MYYFVAVVPVVKNVPIYIALYSAVNGPERGSNLNSNQCLLWLLLNIAYLALVYVKYSIT